jgi:hypothetical protein
LNQARIHGGYHYPRSLRTAARSQRNFQRFVNDYTQSLQQDWTSIYAIARNSKVTPAKFSKVAKMIHAPIRVASPQNTRLFDAHEVSEVFEVTEYSFNRDEVHKTLLAELPPSVQIFNDTEILSIQEQRTNSSHKTEIFLISSHKDYGPYDLCINTTYGELAPPKKDSVVEKLEFEVCELLQVSVPNSLSKISITVMDGPFFSLTPWPAFDSHVLTHVRFTPHSRHQNFKDAQDLIDSGDLVSRSTLAIRDSRRYMPTVKDVAVIGSRYVVKTILARRDYDDARPIVSQEHGRILYLIGSKFDNIYDIEQVLASFIERNKD